MVYSGCTEERLIDAIRRDSSADIEYHPPRSNNPQPKKVRVVANSKTSQGKHASDSGRPEGALGRKQRSEVTRERKPVWNSNIRHKTAPVTQSERDPTYERRRERRLERQRELMALAAANERHIPRRFVSKERQQPNPVTGERQERGKPQRRQPSPHTGRARGQPLSYAADVVYIIMVAIRLENVEKSGNLKVIGKCHGKCVVAIGLLACVMC